MRLLLTSAGIKNTSIENALVDLLGKPIAESSALCIPTAAYGHPMAGPGAAWRSSRTWIRRTCRTIPVEVVSEGHWKLCTPSPQASESAGTSLS